MAARPLSLLDPNIEPSQQRGDRLGRKRSTGSATKPTTVARGLRVAPGSGQVPAARVGTPAPPRSTITSSSASTSSSLAVHIFRDAPVTPQARRGAPTALRRQALSSATANRSQTHSPHLPAHPSLSTVSDVAPVSSMALCSSPMQLCMSPATPTTPHVRSRLNSPHVARSMPASPAVVSSPLPSALLAGALRQLTAPSPRDDAIAMDQLLRTTCLNAPVAVFERIYSLLSLATDRAHMGQTCHLFHRIHTASVHSLKPLNSRISPDSISALDSFPALTRLTLDGWMHGALALTEMSVGVAHRLRVLSVAGVRGLGHVRWALFTELQCLNLSGCAAADLGPPRMLAASLSALPHLRCVLLTDGPVEHIDALRRALGADRVTVMS